MLCDCLLGGDVTEFTGWKGRLVCFLEGQSRDLRQLLMMLSIAAEPILMLGSSRRQFNMNLSFSASHLTGIVGVSFRLDVVN